jgi:hemolysin activation/secretion protein
MKKRIIASLIIFAASGPLFAQNPSPGQEGGPSAERFKQRTEIERGRVEEKKAKPPEIELKEEAKPPAAPAVSFELKDVRVSGSTVFQPQDFQPIYAPYLGKKVTSQDIEEIMKKIEALYKAQGYLTTFAYLPEQQIKEGVIEIGILEGKAGELKVEGNKYFSSALIEKFFHSKKNEILNLRVLQRDVLRLNKISDLELKTVISAGKEPGTSDITLTAKDRFPWHIGTGLSNSGTRLSGKFPPSFYVRGTNATGCADTFYLNTAIASLSLGETLSYGLPLGSYGTKFLLDLTYYKMKMGKEYKVYDITGKTRILSPRLEWELALEEYYEAYFDLGLDIKAITKKTSGNVTSSDQLRIPFFSFSFSKTDAFGGGGQTSFSPRFDFGTSHFLGASSRNHPSASRAGSGGSYFRYSQGLSRTQRMPWGSYLLIKSQFQAASHTLPSSEQVQIGGGSSIRGYPEGDYIADMGGFADFDWVFPCYIIPEAWKLPGARAALRQQLEPVFFFDLGGGKLKKVESGEKEHKFLMGIGGGLKFNYNGKLFLRVDCAKFLGDRPTSGSGPSTYYLSIQYEL